LTARLKKFAASGLNMGFSMNCKNSVLILLRSPSMLPALRPLQHHKHSLIWCQAQRQQHLHQSNTCKAAQLIAKPHSLASATYLATVHGSDSFVHNCILSLSPDLQPASRRIMHHVGGQGLVSFNITDREITMLWPASKSDHI